MARSLIVWDFDGTIADTRGVILNSFADVFAARGFGELDRGAARATIGVPLAEAFSRLLGTDDRALLTGLVADYRRFFAQRVPEEATMFPGIADVLERSRGAGITAAIATSRGRASLVDMLQRFDLVDHFDVVVASEDVTHHKPHPEMVTTILERTVTRPKAALMIGDTTFDIEMGHGAHTRTCAVTWGNESAASLARSAPDHLVETVDDLRMIVSDFVGGTEDP